MATANTLLSWTTKYSADSVEWCPIQGYYNIFVCGTYQLLKEDETDQDKKKDQKRLGELYLFLVTCDTQTLEPIQTIPTSAILDQKWYEKEINGSPHLAVVNASGALQIYKLLKTESYQLEFVVECKLNTEQNILALSLDWTTSKHSTDYPKIVASDSIGNITVCNFEQGANLCIFSTWHAHDYDAWICVFNRWEPDLIITGGDDCVLKVFDTKHDNTLKLTNRCHEAGVTSLHCSNKKENLLASGSYDEKLRLWDTRKLNRPVSELALGGGIWRLKWDPFHDDILLAACMYGGFRIVECKNNGDPIIIAEYNEHESIGYGSDWCRDNSLFKTSSDNENFCRVIATCSFYDCKLDVIKIKY